MKKQYLKYLIIKRNSNEDEIYEYREQERENAILNVLKKQIAPIFTIISTIFSLIVYYVAYVFEKDFVSNYNVSSNYVDINLAKFFQIISPVLIVLISFVILRMIQERQLKKRSYEIPTELQHMFLWQTVLGLVIIFLGVSHGFFNKCNIIACIDFLILIIFIFIIQEVPIKKSGRRETEKEREKFNLKESEKNNSIFDKVRNRINLYLILIVLHFIIALWLFISLFDTKKNQGILFLGAFYFSVSFILSLMSEWFENRIIDIRHSIKNNRFLGIFFGIFFVVLCTGVYYSYIHKNVVELFVQMEPIERYVSFQKNDNLNVYGMIGNTRTFKGKGNKEYYLYYVVYENKDYLCLKPIVDKKGKFIEYKIGGESKKERKNKNKNDEQRETSVIVNPQTTTTYIVNKSKVDVVCTFSKPDDTQKDSEKTKKKSDDTDKESNDIKNIKESLKNDGFTIPN